MNALSNAEEKGSHLELQCSRFTSIAPLVISNSGVSTRNASTSEEDVHWYAMRTTYGREKKAYEYIISHGGCAFYPTIKITKQINGKIVHREQSRIPNIFFVRGTEDDVKHFAYDNIHLPYLRFYYRHHHDGLNIIKSPLIVPNTQIEYLQILCSSDADDILVVPNSVMNFQHGDQVRVIDGAFKGIEGRISRWQGQQRVGVEIEGLCILATAYIPSAFVERL